MGVCTITAWFKPEIKFHATNRSNSFHLEKSSFVLSILISVFFCGCILHCRCIENSKFLFPLSYPADSSFHSNFTIQNRSVASIFHLPKDHSYIESYFTVSKWFIYAVEKTPRTFFRGARFNCIIIQKRVNPLKRRRNNIVSLRNNVGHSNLMKRLFFTVLPLAILICCPSLIF